jgi:hypothetical protein
MRQQLRHVLALSFSSGLVVLASVATAGTQTVVVGTGDPDTDVPAVQAAVDQGGEVILQGHFSFDAEPTVLTALPPPYGIGAMVLVSRPVTISGAPDASGEMASIEAGTVPFYVDAWEARVAIQGLRFVRPNGNGILVYRVSGLVIASCKFEGVDPLGQGFSAIDINTNGPVPTPDHPGSPENVSGTLLIVNNDIDVGATALFARLGVDIRSVGVPGAEVDVYVSGNNIRNISEPAINMRRIVGRARVEGNVVTTGAVSGDASPPGPQVIRAVHLGSYLIAHNSIDCGWANPWAQGIGVYSPDAEWPIERAIVVDNDVTMSSPEGTSSAITAERSRSRALLRATWCSATGFEGAPEPRWR